MKAILMSIHPKWCEKIFNGEKTIEVRKTCPKLEPPFEVLVYCTMPKERWSVGHQIFYNDTLYTLPTGELKIGDALELRADWMRKYNEDNFLNGKVIGSFVCDKVEEIPCYLDAGTYPEYLIEKEELNKTCLSYDELFDYLNGKDGCGWHITEPKLFDKPRELREFSKFGYKYLGGCCVNYNCPNCIDNGWMQPPECKIDGCFLTRPPQSWYYIETDER